LLMIVVGCSGSSKSVVVRLLPESTLPTSSQLDATVVVLRHRLDALHLRSAKVTHDDQSVSVSFSKTADRYRALPVLTAAGQLTLRPTCVQMPVGLPADVYDLALRATAPDCTGSEAAPVDDPSIVESASDPAHPCGSNNLDSPSGDQPVIAPYDQDHNGTAERCLLVGAAALDDRGVLSAQARVPQGQWLVLVTLTDDGHASFNEVIAHCFDKDTHCAAGTAAIVVDGVVISAPQPQERFFTTAEIQITGSFTEADAERLAADVGSGALPIALRAA